MTRKPPPVRDFMTHLPVECEACETIADAVELMKSRDIRHMPVMSGSHLKGILSQHDILEERVRHGAAIDAMPLEAFCRHEVLSVPPLTPVNEVAEKMLSHRCGSAVVVDAGFVVGIFTATDALKALSELFGN